MLGCASSEIVRASNIRYFTIGSKRNVHAIVMNQNPG